MRKAEREIKDIVGIRSVLDTADVCRLGIYSKGEVYIVPMSFGFELTDDGILTLFFHCANEGRKLDMIAENPEVCFELDVVRKLIPPATDYACDSSVSFSSVIGNGHIEILTVNQDRIDALTMLMKKYSDLDNFHFNEKALAATTVLKLTASSYTGKQSKA